MRTDVGPHRVSVGCSGLREDPAVWGRLRGEQSDLGLTRPGLQGLGEGGGGRGGGRRGGGGGEKGRGRRGGGEWGGRIQTG